MVYSSPEQRCYLVSLGSNLPTPVGDPEKTVEWACKSLAGPMNSRVVSSRLFRSPAFPSPDDPEFVNAVAKVYSPLPPRKFLLFVQGLEATCNRVRVGSNRWAPRTLDVDVLACGDVVLPDRATLRRWMALSLPEQQRQIPPEMLLPHPRLHQRGFVLLPLSEVAGDWRHPLLGKTVADMLEDLPAAQLQGIVPLSRRPGPPDGRLADGLSFQQNMI